LKKKLSKIKGLDASKLNQFINGLAKKLDPLTLILHGSLVKGEFVDGLSDIDMIVISPKLENVFELLLKQK
jgi:predicted nucleotidyltransferase